MAKNFHQGAMHWLDITYEDDPDNVETRPVLILHIDSNEVHYFQITKQRGLRHQRKYRPFLKDWSQSGLTYPSYIKINNPLYIAQISDFKSNSYIGDITVSDGANMMRQLTSLGLN